MFALLLALSLLAFSLGDDDVRVAVAVHPKLTTPKGPVVPDLPIKAIVPPIGKCALIRCLPNYHCIRGICVKAIPCPPCFCHPCPPRPCRPCCCPPCPFPLPILDVKVDG